MANMKIRPATGAGNQLIIENQAGTTILSTSDSGATFSGGNIGTVTAGTIGSGVAAEINQPSFCAQRSGSLSMANGTWAGFANSTTLNAGDCYSTSTYKFTPNKAGWYWLYTMISWDDIGDGVHMSAGIFKNAVSGVPVRQRDMRPGSASGGKSVDIASMEYANGTSDYFWFAGTHSHGSARNVLPGNYTVAMGFRLAI